MSEGRLHGTWVTSRAGHRCFVPEPLPPKGLQLSPNVRRAHDEALVLLGQLEGAGSSFEYPALLVHASLTRESIASSTIEGTVASPDELALFQLDSVGGGERVREVDNYNRAVQFGATELERRPITVNLMLELHSTLMSGVRGERHSGRFKSVQNFIGRRAGDRIQDAIFVPSPPEEAHRLMYELESYLNLPQDEPQLVKSGLVHHQFETIHPFGDGNGRVGRLVILLGLIQEHLVSRPVIYPSAYFERTRSDYYRLLTAVRSGEGWDEWLEYYVTGILEQARASLRLIEAIRRAHKESLSLAASAKKRSSNRSVVESFFQHPVRTVAEVAQFAATSDNTARSVIDALVDVGLLREITGRQKGRAYVCEPIWRAIFK